MPVPELPQILASDTLQALPLLTHDLSFPRGFVLTPVQHSALEVNHLCLQSGHTSCSRDFLASFYEDTFDAYQGRHPSLPEHECEWGGLLAGSGGGDGAPIPEDVSVSLSSMVILLSADCSQ